MFTILNWFFNFSDYTAILISVLGEIALWIASHLFMAFGIRYMAKKLNIKGLWMAFVPLLNWYLLGKIIGNAVIWGKQIKNAGFWVMILAVAQFAINFLLSIGTYLYVIEKLFMVEFVFTNSFLIDWVMSTGVLYFIVSSIGFIVDIAYIFFRVSVIFMVFRLYAPDSAMLFSLLSVFIDPIFGILLFVVRKNERNGFRKYYNVYNPYANYTGGGYQTPNQNRPNQTRPSQGSDVDPFPEFSSEKDNSSKPNDSDEFFS